MTQRNTRTQTFQAADHGAGLPLRVLAASILLLVLLITVQTGAGMGFA